MTGLALTLVVTSALIHATWNLLAKRVAGGQVFLCMFTGLSSIVLVPVAVGLILYGKHELDATSAGFILGTTVLHLVYFLCLTRAYQTGDLSLIYPLARGIGPALATLGAILLLGERPTLLAAAGIGLVIAGVLILTVQRSDSALRHPREAVFFGVATGILIASYSVWDKYAVDRLAIPPLILEAFASLGIHLCLLPNAIQRWDEVRTTWRTHRRDVIGVAVLAPLSYILVLTAMSFTPLSYVAPAREISILFAAAFGTIFLGEGQGRRRFIAAVSMVSGVVALSIGSAQADPPPEASTSQQHTRRTL